MVGIILSGFAFTSDATGPFGALLLVAGALALTFGGIGTVRGIRAARLIRRSPWMACPARTGWNFRHQVIEFPQQPPECRVFLRSATRETGSRFDRKRATTVMVAGLPSRWVVVAAPDSATVVIAKQPRFPWQRPNLHKMFWR
jgi:hypothetical protein